MQWLLYVHFATAVAHCQIMRLGMQLPLIFPLCFPYLSMPVLFNIIIDIWCEYFVNVLMPHHIMSVVMFTKLFVVMLTKLFVVMLTQLAARFSRQSGNFCPSNNFHPNLHAISLQYP